MKRWRYAGRGRGSRPSVSSGLGGLALVIAIAAGCDDGNDGNGDGGAEGLAGPSSGTMIPAATGCTNPSDSGPPPMGGLEPRQIAAAYGIDKLWDAGFRGQGRRVALIEFRQRLDKESFRKFFDCWGPFAIPNEIVVGGGSPPIPGGEANFDLEVLLAVAPGVERVDLFETASDSTPREQLAVLLAAALDPANTGGKLVHTISISFADCEVSWSQTDLDAANAQLRRAAELGVKVFVSQGDAGSPSFFLDRETGKAQCVPWPAPAMPPHDVQLGVSFPPSSPWVTAVGGTELAINGRIPESGSPDGGTVTNEVVWNQPASGGRHWAGSGGLSKIFSVSDAPWQEALGLAGRFHRPDVSALAGSPKYTGGGIGTSGSAPFVAGAMMVVDSYLVGHGVEPPGFLNPILYELALTDYERVFFDVVDGNNDVYDLGCCYAKRGYDVASGLGSIRFDELAEVLLERAGAR